MAQGGLGAVSMRAVADGVGVSATALYHYFDNKDALVRAVVESGFRQFGEYLDAASRDHARGSRERVRAIGEGYVRFALEHPAYFRVLFGREWPDLNGVEDLPEGGGYGLLRQALVDAMAAGTIRQADPDLLVMYLWSLVHGLVMLTLACGFDRDGNCGPASLDRTPTELFTAFQDFVRTGIAGPAPAPNDNGGR